MESPLKLKSYAFALRIVRASKYWLSILKDTQYIEEPIYLSMTKDCSELIKMLVSSVKTAKNNKYK